MKGVIFVEFLEMLDNELGMEATEGIIEESNLKSQGAYTAVGTYEDEEMITLITNLHKKTNIPVPELLTKFSKHLFQGFLKRYPDMLVSFTDGFDLLRKIDNQIHVQVKKLYPQAILPKFEFEQISDTELKMIYKSTRKMPDLAEGMISSTMTHFNEPFTIRREYIEEDGGWVNFYIKKQ
jgi:hypothetical protein